MYYIHLKADTSYVKIVLKSEAATINKIAQESQGA